MAEKLDKEKLKAELAGGGYLKSAFDPTGQTPHYVRYMDKAERGLHTVKLFVYAGMTAFVVLATFGFYLISRLTDDATRMADTIEQMQATGLYALFHNFGTSGLTAGAVASGDFASVLDAMSAMNAPGTVIEPSRGDVAEYHRKKHTVFQRMHGDQLAYRALMR